MIVDFRLPAIVPHMSTAIVECIHVQVGSHLPVGQKLIDVSVDLSSAFTQDCPPISYFRIVLRESAWLQRLDVTAGQSLAIGQLLALFGTERDDSAEQASQRAVRITTAGIMHHAGMWSGSFA